MKIDLSIHYITNPGESLFVKSSINYNGYIEDRVIEHTKTDDNFWFFSFEPKESCSLNYIYSIIDQNGICRFEAGGPRELVYESGIDIRIYDEWRCMDDNAPFLSDAFRKVFLHKEEYNFKRGELQISVPPIIHNSDYKLFISGNCNVLGGWDPEKSVLMKADKNGYMCFKCKFDEVADFFEYKFIIWDGENFIWESGDNRRVATNSFCKYNSVIINHYQVNIFYSKPKFCGTSIPVFSLRSKNSAGIGDFGDMVNFIDLLHLTNQNIFQILPVNDTTRYHDNRDSYPYGSISVFALNPIYLNLKMAGEIEEDKFDVWYSEEIKKLNISKELDYNGVIKLKRLYIKKLFEQDSDRLFKSNEFKQFFNKNCDWLVPYAVFCYLRDRYGTANFRNWKKYSTYNEVEIFNLASAESDESGNISINFFIQYHLDKQLKAAHEYAQQKQVILKGDIPIGINRDSVDAWIYPQLFDFNSQAGAPPDDFSEDGQNWGFPTYRWNIMERDGLSWWRRRLIKMSEYFDAYRIDHVLGFFRIWEIPAALEKSICGIFNPSLPYSYEEIIKTGLIFQEDKMCLDTSIKNTISNDSEFDLLFIKDINDGKFFHPRISGFRTKMFDNLPESQKIAYKNLYDNYFYKRNENLWYESAMKKLPTIISATGMMACAEDLGMVPSCVKDVLDELKILSLQIQRMPKNSGVKFDKTDEYPYLSVCTTSTHDTSTLRGWWRENETADKIYFNTILNKSGDLPTECEPWLCKTIIENHLNSPSIFSIIPIQDWFSLFDELRRNDIESERINDPSNPSNYWGYRMHIDIEELISNKEFISTVKTLVRTSRRGTNLIDN